MTPRFQPLPIGLCLTLLALHPAAAQAPDPDLLRRMVPKLERILGPAKIAFERAKGETGEGCGMQPFEMVLSRGPVTRRYSVLLDTQGNGPVRPRQVFAQITRLTVDADGSLRAYHPDDPLGEGVCHVSGSGAARQLEGVCALDRFASGQMHVFRDGDKLTKAEFASAWREIWPLIRDRKLRPFNLDAITPVPAPAGYYLFHSAEQKLTAFFKRPIIPSTHDGYPCLHGPASRTPGYFVAATTLLNNRPARADGCAPARYMDAERIPFFVLPGGAFGGIEIGDVVIARLKRDGVDGVVYGVAGDAGPITNFGEGSIAFNQALLGRSGELVMNVKDVWKLDIDGPAISVLILGGTKHLLNGDYSRKNIEIVARREFARWGGGAEPLRRLDICAAQGTVNGKK